MANASVAICELALRGLGVGLDNPITALDYAARGVVLRKFSIDVSFACLLVRYCPTRRRVCDASRAVGKLKK